MPVLELAVPACNGADIDGIQKVAITIILKDFTGKIQFFYEEASVILGLETLDIRRNKNCKKFNKTI